MRLVYLPVNNAWSFALVGEDITLIRMDGWYLFFTSRREAVKAAHAKGLHVHANGEVM